MIDTTRLAASLDQIGRMIRGIQDLHRTVLPKNPQLYAEWAEGPMDLISQIQGQALELVTHDQGKLRFSLEQIGRLFDELADLHGTVLRKNPNLFASKAEALLDEIEKSRRELVEHVNQLMTEEVAAT
jgi:hypothetical protein